MVPIVQIRKGDADTREPRDKGFKLRIFKIRTAATT